MKWSTVCKAKLKRGLGVRSLSLLNKAFLCKWCWRFSSEKEPLWKNIIKGKFEEEERGYRLGVLREPYGVRVRRAIGKQWDMFNSKASFAVGSKSIFGKIGGATRSPYVRPSRPCLPYLIRKRHG